MMMINIDGHHSSSLLMKQTKLVVCTISKSNLLWQIYCYFRSISTFGAQCNLQILMNNVGMQQFIVYKIMQLQQQQQQG